jgi:hypothetical protein
MSNKLIADLMSFRSRMVADDRTQVMFEGDFDTIDQVIATLRKAHLAAPQQAIPSGYALVPYDVLARIKNLPRFSFLSPPEGGVRRFADTSGNWIEQYEVIKLLDDYIYSASPTAPIESDK